jgi:hypothetical protein
MNRKICFNWRESFLILNNESRNKSIGSVSDPDSMNPDPDILLNPDPDILRNPDPGCCWILNQAVAESGSNQDPDRDQGFVTKYFLSRNVINVFLNPYEGNSGHS